MACVIRRNHSSKIRRSSHIVEPVRYEELHKCIAGRNQIALLRPEESSGAALTPEFMLITVVIILTEALCAGLFGKFVGFYPVEAAITSGLC